MRLFHLDVFFSQKYNAKELNVVGDVFLFYLERKKPKYASDFSGTIIFCKKFQILKYQNDDL